MTINMKQYILKFAAAVLTICAIPSCFNLDEEAFDRVSSSIYYSDESSVQGALASIYNEAANKFVEYFYYLQEFSADQIAWRSWNGGAWGYDEGQKFVLSTHTWTSESVIIRQAWENAWTVIGLCNNVIYDLQRLDPASLGMTQAKADSYIAEVRTMRAWSYYNLFELWGGALPLNIAVTSEVPPTADPDFDTSCKKIYDFIMTELDESLEALPQNNVNRMNQAVNRVLKARLLINSEIFIKENRFADCADVCQEILDGKYGNYSIATDYRSLYSVNNDMCPEVIMAFACEDGQAMGNLWNIRNVHFLPYNIWEYFGEPISTQGGWNCCCLAPSYDNSANFIETGGTGAVCFLDAPYNDKLGAVYERYCDKDIRKQNIVINADGSYQGQFLKGAMRANYGEGDILEADADRQTGEGYVFVDQVGTFLNLGRTLETVMSPRWGETNSGVRFVKYPMYPATTGLNFKNADEVEFRLAEVVYMLAECKLRAGDSNGAKTLVNSVRQRYFSPADWAAEQNNPGRGFTAFDEDWMLSQWGLEYLGEGRRRRTDLRRFDKFTQGQWWFFGRSAELDGTQWQAARDRKYEWFPLPESALTVNPGLVQNPNY